MSFLIKMALFVAVVILCIPADQAELAKVREDHRTFGIFDYYGLAQAAYNDASGFCGRNPVACETGSAFLDTFQAKARTGVTWVSGYLSPAAPAKPAAEPHPAEATGSVATLKVPLPPRKPAIPRQPT